MYLTLGYTYISKYFTLTELEIHPEKHMYTDYNSGNTYIYNGATITMKCKDRTKTFTKALVKKIGRYHFFYCGILNLLLRQKFSRDLGAGVVHR